jgi:hypothetical protein
MKVTEATLKASHQEALDIYHAWVHRHRVTGGNEAAAVKMQMDDAWEWVQRTDEDLRTWRQATRGLRRKVAA